MSTMQRQDGWRNCLYQSWGNPDGAIPSCGDVFDWIVLLSRRRYDPISLTASSQKYPHKASVF